MSQHKVIEDKLHWTSDDPEVGEVVIPLRFKGKILKQAKEYQDDDLGFMFFVLHAIGVPEDVTDEMDALEIRAMFSAWQSAWQGRAEATLGEASRSSN